MDQATINLWAILAAVAVKQGLGWLWYSPMLFGRAFAAAARQAPAQRAPSLGRAIGGDIAGALVMAFALAHVVSFGGVVSALFGALVGLICWAGFIGPTTLSPTLFETRPLKLWALQNGYLVLALAAMGAILGGWR